MDKFSELKAAAMAATPGRIGDRIDGSGSIKYECTGYDGSLVLRTDHKDMEYGFVGDNADADELFFRLCVPDVVLALLAELEAKDEQNKLLMREVEHGKKLRVNMQNNADSLSERIAELEAKLATPVRLPEKYNMKMAGDKSTKSMFYGHNSAINDSAKAIRAAGFTAGEE